MFLRNISSLAWALVCAMGLTNAAWAQQTPAVHECGIEAAYQLHFDNPAAYQQALEALRHEADGHAPLGKKTTFASGTEYVLPMVVHVFHSGWGQPDSISYAQVVDQVRVMFEDFRRVPGTAGFGGQSVDTRIEFSLASRDPQGNPHSGVTYTNRPDLARQTGRTTESQMKNLVRWDSTRYVNVWLVREIGGQGSGDVTLGYAYYPSSSSFLGPVDGIVIDSKYWGTIGSAGSGNFGRTATHEMGHFLALPHTFEGGCSITNDGIQDTPPTAKENFGSNYNRKNSCNNDVPFDRADNPNNHMDYSDGAFRNAFTAGQTQRMTSSLNNPSFTRRFFLHVSSNLEFTGTGPWGHPSAYFWQSSREICAGGSVQFTDYSRNTPTEYQWSFPGGTPATASGPNPVVTYNTPGTYAVELIVRNLNADGIEDTLRREDWITVTDHVASVPFHEGFSTFMPPPNWVIDNQDGGRTVGSYTWDSFFLGGGYDTSSSCARMRMHQYNDYDQLDGLITPALDLSEVDSASLTFAHFYFPFDYGGSSTPIFRMMYADTLTVYASADCGLSWDPIFRKGGEDLATAATERVVSGTPQEPRDLKASLWRTDTISLQPYVGNPNVRIKFETKNGFGNTLFLDDVTVEPFGYPEALVDSVPDSIPDSRAQAHALSTPPALAPNPSAGLTEVLLRDLSRPANVQLSVMDAMGRELLPSQNLRLEAGTHRLPLDLSALPTGLYQIRIQVDGLPYLRTLLKQ